MKHWLIHTAIFLAAQVLFAVLGYSWPWEVLTGRIPVSSILNTVTESTWTANTSRIWTIVWVIDGVVSIIASLSKKSSGSDGSASSAKDR